MEEQPTGVAPIRARSAIRIRGTVQAVGFRPAVHRLAHALELSGFVRNDSDCVHVEIEGDAEAVDDFLRLLPRFAPSPARIDSIVARPLAPLGDREFRIAASAGEQPTATFSTIPPDLAPCADCLRELADPQNRRYRYPFINCTACGPRYSIVRALPYDRAQTTMDAFALCARCRREYDDPADRRFHAEPNACAACGPQIEWRGSGETLRAEAALARAVRALGNGEIVAAKGAGGFVLAVDAGNEPAVARLRARKRRPDKPLAVLVRSLDEARLVARLEPAAERALLSPARPIVLVPMRPNRTLAPSVAPQLREVGLFLAPTPLQQLLVSDGPPLLVMTSGNVSDDPIAKDNAEALERLGKLADGFLLHDREIHNRVDDSVLRILGGQAVPLRRARGLTPEVIRLPSSGPAVLAVGAAQRNTICLAEGGRATLSQHLGDLDHPETQRFFEETIDKLGRLSGTQPRVVAHDLHPDYPSTRWAWQRGLLLEPVQHHHAHIASCLADNGQAGPVIGIAFDGTGCGLDGSLWGGEILEADLSTFRRLGHLQSLRLPGGEAAIAEPWRVAVAALISAGEPLDLLGRIASDRLHDVVQLLARDLASPPATGAGRWFDAVAALCGLRQTISYEGQGALELEAAAAPQLVPAYPFSIAEQPAGAPFVVELRGMVRALAAELRRQTTVAMVAARFHETLAQAVAAACRRAHTAGAPRTVALSGGCFQNRRLLERTTELLSAAGFAVLSHRRVPSGDAGLALGQAAIASFRRRTHEANEPCA